MDGAKISPKTLDSENDIDTLCLRAVHALMKDGASRKKLAPRDIRAQKRTRLNHVSNETKLSNLDDLLKMVVAPSLPESLDSTRTRANAHPTHVISTAISPELLDTWPEKQDVNDINDQIRLFPDQQRRSILLISSSSY